MQFPVALMEDAAQEIKLADRYPLIRLFTVGQMTASSAPLSDLHTVEAPWAVANHTSITGPGWGSFSAVCWIFGREAGLKQTLWSRLCQVSSARHPHWDSHTPVPWATAQCRHFL